jgi:hypothetical protein
MDRPTLHLLDGRDDPAFDPSYVYHATSAERAVEIAHDGMLYAHEPHEHTDDQRAWPDGSVEKRVYFGETTNLSHFAPEEGEPVILRMPRPAGIRRDGRTPDLYIAGDVDASQMEVCLAGGEWIALSELARPEASGPSL